MSQFGAAENYISLSTFPRTGMVENPYSHLDPRTVEAVKRLNDIAFAKKPGPDPDCPYCVTTGDSDPQVAAEKICGSSPAGEKDNCISMMRGLGHIEDRPAWDGVAKRLTEVTGQTPLVEAFLGHAKRLWFKETPTPPDKEAAGGGGGASFPEGSSIHAPPTPPASSKTSSVSRP